MKAISDRGNSMSTDVRMSGLHFLERQVRRLKIRREAILGQFLIAMPESMCLILRRP